MSEESRLSRSALLDVRRDRLDHLVDWLDRYFIWILLLLVGIGATAANPVFLQPRNLSNILAASAFLGCLEIAQAFVLVTGNLDLSTEANMVFSAIVATRLMEPASSLAAPAGGLGLSGIGLPWPLGIGVILLVPTLIGAANGFMVARLQMNGFMTTLGTLVFLQGAALIAGQSQMITSVPDAIQFLGGGMLGPLPVASVILILVLLATHVVFTRTSFGWQLFAVGSNRRAARTSGINDVSIVFRAYVMAGFFSGLGGLLLVGRLATASPGMSTGNFFTSVAAAVIGGVSLFGGEARVIGMLGGLLVLISITNALNFANIPSEMVSCVTGSVVLFAIFIDSLRARRRAR